MKIKLEELRNTYKLGSKVELVKMDDVQAPPIGISVAVEKSSGFSTIFHLFWGILPLLQAKQSKKI